MCGTAACGGDSVGLPACLLLAAGPCAGNPGKPSSLRPPCAQVNDGPCVTYIGPGGAGNFVKMVHNGIEYGDMQLISEAYDVLRTVGGLGNEELVEAFNEWNKVCLFC